MINLLMIVGGVVNSEYSVSISPSDYFTSAPNGSFTTPYFESSVSGGVGPYVYQWSVSGLSTIVGDGEKVRIKTGGYNDEVGGVLSLTVTDEGNGNAELSASCNYSILFGVPR